MSGKAYDVAIAGGGVIGCATACELAQRGLSVVLLERERIGAGASSAAAGILSAQPDAQAPDEWFRMLLAARAEHGPLASRLLDETGIDVGYRRDGVLRVAVNETEGRELRERAAWQQREGLAAEWLSTGDAGRLEPCLTPDMAGAGWFADEAQVHAPRFVQALGLWAAKLGVDVREGTPVLGIEAGGRVDAIRIPNERLAVGAVVLAAGVWTRGLDSRLPVEPVKGEIVSGVLSPDCAPRHVLSGLGVYLAPKADGRLVVGATEQPGRFDLRPTLGAVAGLISAGARLLPSLAAMPLSSAWAGLRPAVADRRPVLGEMEGVERLFVATGHYRKGILLGPLTAKLMARVIVGEPGGVDLSPYSPNRFLHQPVLS